MNQKIINIPDFEGDGDVFTCTRETPYDPRGSYTKPIFHPDAYDVGDGSVFCPICLTHFDEATRN